MMNKVVLLVLVTLALVNGYPFQKQLSYLKRLVRRDAYTTWKLEDFPDPRVQFKECGRLRSSTVCDPNAVLMTEQVSNLDFMISRIKNETSCVCEKCQSGPDLNQGISVGIAIMKNMYHDYHDDQSLRAEEFTKGLMAKWNLGTCEDSIIILLAIENQQFFAISGKTVKKVLDDDMLDKIFEDIKGHFTDKRFYQGLESLVQSIYDQIRINRAPQQNDETTTTGSIGLTVGLVVGFLALALLFAAGVIVVRRKQQGNGDKFMFDSHKTTAAKREGQKGNIVKVPVVFPDAVYQPCSIEDPAGNNPKGSDEELNLTERKSSHQVDSKTPLRDMPDIHNGMMRHELSRVDEEDSKDILEEIDVDDPEEKIVFAQSNPMKPPRSNISGNRA